MGSDALYGAVVSVAFNVPSRKNSTFVTRSLSLAAALALSVRPTFTEPGETETIGFWTSTQLIDTERLSSSFTVQLEPLQSPLQAGAKPVWPDADRVYESQSAGS